MKYLTKILFVSLFSLTSFGLVHAGTFNAFGPANFIREVGSPAAVINNFSVLNPNVQYILQISNGGLEDSEIELVSSSVILLNGVQVVGPAEFNQNVAFLEVDVTQEIAINNELSVELRGKPGGVITIIIVGTDNDLPTIVATATPGPNANGWNNTDVTVSFDCQDFTSGIASCTIPITISLEGAGQIISGTAVDFAGNIATTSITLKIDKTPPTITGTGLPAANAAVWNNTDVTVTFVCTDLLSGIAECPGPFLLTLEGANQIVAATSRDQADNEASGSISINIDKTQPVISITDPIGGLVTSVQDIVVNGTVIEANTISSLTCNSQTGTVSAGLFSCSISLVEGFNPILVETIDIAGNLGSSSITVEFVPPDIIPPFVTITDPPNLSLFASSPITVSGTIDDVTAGVSVNGVPATVSGNNFTAAGVVLKEGINLITATATDPANNAGTNTISVTLDTTPPIVVIQTPEDGTVTNQATIDVAGVVNDITTGQVNGDDVTVTVEVEGNSIQASVSNGSFLAVGIPLLPRPQLITAIATDKVGNTGSTSITVRKQDLQGQAITPISGNNQSGTIGTTLFDPLVVQLIDAQGNPVQNRPVTFTVIRSDGILSTPLEEGRSLRVFTDAQGLAQTFLTLGTRAGAGNNRVRATAVGFVGDVFFCGSALPGNPTGIKIVSGENQTGGVNQPLPNPYVIMVHDSGGNPVGGVQVSFEVVEGGGSLNGNLTFSVTTDTDGRAASVLTLDSLEGINNNTVLASFPSLLESPATFRASALIPGPLEETEVSGVVLDNSNNPIPNVTVKILDSTLETITNDQGRFLIVGAPVGSITLEVDGTTTTLLGTWPVLDFDMTTISGQNNTIGMPIFLLPLDVGNAKVVGGNADVTLEMANVPGVALTVFANSVTCPDGSNQCQAMITQVHRDKVPMPPPEGASPRLVWTIQPAGILFDPPARITYPNVDGLPPGQIVDVVSFDHDLGQFVSVGTGTVSEDGSVINSDPGVGIRKGGWGFIRRIIRFFTTCIDQCGPCQICRPTFFGARCVPESDGTFCTSDNPCTTGSGQCQNGTCQVPLKATVLCDPQENCNENDESVWFTLIEDCVSKSQNLRDLCALSEFNNVIFNLGRNQLGVLVDRLADNKIDLSDLETLDSLKPECQWGVDSCQAINHIVGERIDPSPIEGDKHKTGKLMASNYRSDVGLPGTVIKADECAPPFAGLICVDYDEDGVLSVPEFTEFWTLGPDLTTITGKICPKSQ